MQHRKAGKGLGMRLVYSSDLLLYVVLRIHHFSCLRRPCKMCHMCLSLLIFVVVFAIEKTDNIMNINEIKYNENFQISDKKHDMCIITVAVLVKRYTRMVAIMKTAIFRLVLYMT